MNYLEQIQELVDRSYQLPNNFTKIHLIEAAIKLADSYQNIEEGFELRSYLISTLYKCGYPEKLLVAFSWCLAQYDRDPEKFRHHEWRLMWHYKWILEKLARFPQISRQQIENSFADMKQRYLQLGISLRAVYQHQFMVSMYMGDFDLAPQYYQQWQDAPEDSSKDCAGCELDRVVWYLLAMDKTESALHKAQPIITGKLYCAELPHLTLSRFLVPLVKLKQLDLAQEYHLQSCHKVTGNNKFLEQLAEQILFLALVENNVKAITLIEQNIIIALTTHDVSDRFDFYRAVIFLIDNLLAENTEKISLLMPRDFPLYTQEGEYNLQDLLNWFESEAKTIAQQFDLRNGNQYYSERLQELSTLKQYIIDYQIDTQTQLNSSANLNRGEILQPFSVE